MPKIVFASDHAGYALKEQLKAWLPEGQDWEIIDLGTDGDASVDYPDFGHDAGRAIAAGQADLGVIVCGSGIGISIAANRHPGVRAALCLTPEMAMLARQHNNANILALGARLTEPEVAKECLHRFLATAFEGGRHEGRVKKLG